MKDVVAKFDDRSKLRKNVFKFLGLIFIPSARRGYSIYKLDSAVYSDAPEHCLGYRLRHLSKRPEHFFGDLFPQ